MTESNRSAAALVVLVVVLALVTIEAQPPASFAYFVGSACFVGLILAFKLYRK